MPCSTVIVNGCSGSYRDMENADRMSKGSCRIPVIQHKRTHRYRTSLCTFKRNFNLGIFKNILEHFFSIGLDDFHGRMPFYVKLYILPNRVSIEIVNWLQILIKVYICSKGYVGIMC